MEETAPDRRGGTASYLPERIRVCVCSSDEDLRTWIVEELRLMTWIGELELSVRSTIHDEGFDPPALDLIVLGTDHVAAADRESIANRTWTTPLIVVGETRVAGDRHFGSRLTSRELKQAIRELVFAKR